MCVNLARGTQELLIDQSDNGEETGRSRAAAYGQSCRKVIDYVMADWCRGSLQNRWDNDPTCLA